MNWSYYREVQESAGLFCVLTNIVHGIQLDDEVEVYSNVCRVRRLMPEIVTSLAVSYTHLTLPTMAVV